MKGQVKKFNGNYFLSIQKFLPEEILEGLIESCDTLITDRKKDPQYEVFPPEATWSILGHVEDQYVWQTLFDRVRLSIVQYCKLADINYKNVVLHSSWVTRYNGLPEDDPLAKNKIDTFTPYKNLHNHDNNPIGVIIYLKNPDPKYGTMVKVSDKQIYMHQGIENTALIYDARLYHSAIYPPLELVEKHPRYTVVVDTAIAKKDSYLLKTDSPELDPTVAPSQAA
tara:strand:- start:1177 stop:1851 length:675 start_codon:yes stop_codon:yes gene_type:complete